VTLRIDTSRALATYEERAALVHAVVDAQPEDELDWIEWKIGGDLSKWPTQGTIARHILGMANRMPDRAMSHAGGYGYLIMGAEPGSAPGIAKVDPANLGQGVQSFLGTEGPAWWPHYDEEQGVSVLVIVVEPPQPGQRIFTLRKTLTVTNPKGTSTEAETLRSSGSQTQPSRTVAISIYTDAHGQIAPQNEEPPDGN